MPPSGKSLGDVLDANQYNLRDYGALAMANFFEERAREVKDIIKSNHLVWTDLPPYVVAAPERPPEGVGIINLERTINPAAQMPTIYILGGCEFKAGALLPFCNSDINLVSISPHMVSRFKMEGPFSVGKLVGPFQSDFCPIINRSYPGQSFEEIAVDSGFEYLSEWCTTKPRVTILGVGFWDAVLGNIVWTPECVTKGVFATYYLSMLKEFIRKARVFSCSNRIDFDAWFVHHKFVILPIPSWVKLTEEMYSRGTISVSTYDKLRPVIYKDLYKMQPYLWTEFQAIVYCPTMPHDQLHTVGLNYTLGPTMSKLYVGQVLALASKLLCAKPKCKCPNDFQLVKAHLLTHDDSCGRYVARFLPRGSSFQRLWDDGDL